jgi:hypothetical protein
MIPTVEQMKIATQSVTSAAVPIEAVQRGMPLRKHITTTILWITDCVIVLILAAFRKTGMKIVARAHLLIKIKDIVIKKMMLAGGYPSLKNIQLRYLA